MDLQDLSAKVDLLLKEQQAFREQQQALLDRQAIYDCMMAYCRGMDRMDTELVVSAYQPDAIDDHGAIVGPPRPFVAWAEASHRTLTSTQHMITNHIVELDGDVAHAESYWFAACRLKDSEEVTFSGGRYLDRLEKRDGRWGIAVRRCLLEWGGTPTMDPLSEEDLRIWSGSRGSRDLDDASYRRPQFIDPERIGLGVPNAHPTDD